MSFWAGAKYFMVELLFCASIAARAADTETQRTQTSPDPAALTIEIKKLFAANCSWCHEDYGRKGGKAPRLAGTRMNEHQLEDRIRDGKPGAMPSFRRSLTDEQVSAFARYIKSLEPSEP
jgi:mono/diheme cytochrome c family protein